MRQNRFKRNVTFIVLFAIIGFFVGYYFFGSIVGVRIPIKFIFSENSMNVNTIGEFNDILFILNSIRERIFIASIIGGIIGLVIAFIYNPNEEKNATLKTNAKIDNTPDDLSQKHENQEQNLKESEIIAYTKKCPFCAEEINIDAIKCKHCGEFLKSNTNEIKQEKIRNRIQFSKFKFNFYWLYGFIAIAMIVIYLFNLDSGPVLITWDKFERVILRTGDVEKLVVINNKTVHIYIKKGKLTMPKYKDVTGFFSNISKPQYYFEIGSIEVFEKRLEDAQQEIPDDVKITPTYRNIE